MATSAIATQLPTPEPVLPETHAPAVGGDDGTPTQTTTASASTIPAIVHSDVPPPVSQGPMPGDTDKDPVGEAVITPSPTQSAAVVGRDPALHTKWA